MIDHARWLDGKCSIEIEIKLNVKDKLGTDRKIKFVGSRNM